MGALARFRAVWFSLAAWFSLTACFALAVGCSNQGEGERCDRANNGNGDCAEPLVCTPKKDNVALCCPTNPLTSSAPQCRQNDTSSSVDAGGSPAADAGTTESDSAAEAAEEQGAESGI